ncbi:MAG: DUF2625 domain-containing protein, partial [Candidatus Methanomethyliaceae archaeon]|nr:DUF2625 domain-containing protein [Candidatus Methanomethyliaceae archaeon]
MKNLDDLINGNDSALPIVQDWISKAKHKVEILPTNDINAKKVLLDLQVTTRSPLGAIAYYTGGIIFDNGWLRFLGSGCDRLRRNLSNWNGIDNTGKCKRLDGAFLFADDVIGGFFALNGGAFEGELNKVFYLAPESLKWENTDKSFSD